MSGVRVDSTYALLAPPARPLQVHCRRFAHAFDKALPPIGAVLLVKSVREASVQGSKRRDTAKNIERRERSLLAQFLFRIASLRCEKSGARPFATAGCRNAMRGWWYRNRAVAIIGL